MSDNYVQVRLLRIFISSPSDVTEERKIAQDEIEYLVNRPVFREKVSFRVIAWDKKGAGTVMRARLSPQEAINQGLPMPSECDIVISLFWSRIGTSFMLNNKDYLSGTHFELLNALESQRPEVVIYHRTEPVTLDPASPTYNDDSQQLQALQSFLRSDLFYDPVTKQIRRAVTPYRNLEEFRRQLSTDLEQLILDILKRQKTPVDIVPSTPHENVVTINPSVWQGSPFPGLRSFTEKQAPIFFGRNRETDALIRGMRDRRVMAIVGASASGKSSLVRAGMLPRLRADAIPGSRDWHIVPFRPGMNIFENMAESLMDNVPALACNDPIIYPERLETLAESLQARPDRLAKTLRQALKNEVDWAEVVIFIDQLEELFTFSSREQWAYFADMLEAALLEERIRIIMTLRADFFHRALELPALARLLEASFPVAAPTGGALYQMITRPAERAALEFEAGLAEKILEDTGTAPGALALMAYVLDELYKFTEKQGHRHLTFDAYAALGGVQKAIGERAENVLQSLGSDTKALHRMFMMLVEVDERGLAVRRRAVFPATQALDPMLQGFINARLLTSDQDAEGISVEVAHEALFHSWNRMEAWIEDAHEDLILLRQLRTAATEWKRQNRPDFLHWPAERLKLVYAMQSRLQPELDDTTLSFIESEQSRLLQELEAVDTPHVRRSRIGERLAEIGDTRPGTGLNDGGMPDLSWCEVKPGHITIDDQVFGFSGFYIARYLITNAQFAAFINAPDGAANPEWWRDFPETVTVYGDEIRVNHIENGRTNLPNYPRDNVNWYQAVAFCQWLTTQYQQSSANLFTNSSIAKDPSTLQIRLPTEWEWQWAACGGDASRLYPWGTWDARFANTIDAHINERATAVGMYPHGAAESGALDMAGNLWEWGSNNFEKPYPIFDFDMSKKAVRGGSFYNDPDNAACTFRGSLHPGSKGPYFGMRVICCWS